MADPSYETWIPVFSSGTDYESDLVRDRLDDADIPAVVLTQRDHAFNLNVGDLAAVHVMVPPGRAEEARALLGSEAISDEELEEAALNADPHAPDKYDTQGEAKLDSGIEDIELDVPDDTGDDVDDGDEKR